MPNTESSTHYMTSATNKGDIMTINLNKEIVNYQPFSKDIVSLVIIGQALLVAYVMGVVVYFA